MKRFNFAAAGLALFALAGCSDPDGTKPATARQAIPRDGVQRIEITGGSYSSRATGSGGCTGCSRSWMRRRSQAAGSLHEI